MKELWKELLIERDAQRVEKEMEENLPVLYVLTWTTVQKTKNLLYKKYESNTLAFTFDSLSKVTNVFEEYQKSILEQGYVKSEDTFFADDYSLNVRFSAENAEEQHVLEISTTKMNKTLNGFC